MSNRIFFGILIMYLLLGFLGAYGKIFGYSDLGNIMLSISVISSIPMIYFCVKYLVNRVNQ